MLDIITAIAGAVLPYAIIILALVGCEALCLIGCLIAKKVKRKIRRMIKESKRHGK